MNKYFKKILFLLCFAVSCYAFAQQAERKDALKLYNADQYEEAIEVCEKEIAANPDSLDSYCVLCWALVANKQYMAAEERAAKARELFPYDVRLIEVLAESKFYQGKNSEALVLFQKYVASAPESATRYGRAYFFMGEIYIRQSQFYHADIALTASVRYDSLRYYWWSQLGYAREMCKNYKTAIAAYDKALSINPGDYDSTRGKSRCESHL
ncbi:MAG: tetratricopeptide repeat protein [Treponema sp.]|nr:tetratricopeptide repeat protein [Treponema sp.]